MVFSVGELVIMITISMMVGATCGFFICALCAMAAQTSRDLEREAKERQ